MSDEPKMEVPVEAWAKLKLTVEHIDKSIKELRDEIKEMKENIATRVSALENWKSAEEGASKIKNFWIPIFVSATVAIVIAVVTKLIK